MPRTLNELITSLSEAERARIKVRARELIAEELSLQNLREGSVIPRRDSSGGPTRD